MIKIIKTEVGKFLQLVGILCVTYIVWSALEKAMDGIITRSKADTIMWLILSTSIYLNMRRRANND